MDYIAAVSCRYDKVPAGFGILLQIIDVTATKAARLQFACAPSNFQKLNRDAAMESGIDWLSTEVKAAFVGTACAFIFSGVKDWRARCQKRKSHWCALRAEIEVCRDKAETYLRDNIIAPLYRLPTIAYSQSFPALLSDAAVAEGEVKSLIEFFTEVESLNRGLDLAQTARERRDEEAVQQEYGRNRLKAERLVPPPPGNKNYYTSVRAVVDAHAPPLPTAPRRPGS